MGRLLRDKAVLAGSASLAAFAIGVAVLFTWNERVGSADAHLVDTSVAQVQRTHEMTTFALLLSDGDVDRAPQLASTLEVFEDTHRDLRDASGTGMEARFTAIEPSFVAVGAATRAMLAAPGSPQLGVGVADAAADYRLQVTEISSRLSAAASRRDIRSRQLELVAATVGFSLAIMLLMVAAHRRRRSDAARHRFPGPSELDQLTGLPSRAALREHLIETILVRPPDTGFVSLLLIDLRPTSTHHGNGGRRIHDRVIQEAARRLRSTVRSTDLVARTARSRFGVVIERTMRAEDASKVADKVVDALSAGVNVGSARVDLVPAIGIALSPLDATSADGLLEKAGLALRIAAERPGAAYRYFSPELRPDSASRVAIAVSLKEAIADGEQLWLAYQPKIRLSDSAVIGFEALARWSHPELGSVPPTEFISIAEESDLIIEVGEWVIDTVCKQLAEWRRNGRHLVPVSVNVSTREFRHGDLDTTVAAALERHGVPAELLEVEITEGVLIDGHEEPLRHMEDLQELGIRIAVDDFGTGYSSLSYLKRLPIDTLKIDRSFISELHEGTEDAAIATAIIALAHSLGLRVVAEGVESREQLEILLTLGCDIAQGFYFGRPAPAADVHRLWPDTLPASGAAASRLTVR